METAHIGQHKKIIWLLFSLGTLIFFYSFFRAYFLSFTNDESFCYLEYVRRDWKIINGKTTANNHLLNTWLMKISANSFGLSEIILRLPNVLAHLLFLYFSAKIILALRAPALIAGSSFLIINLNPFVLDFFSLARGYGISMGLLMGALYYTHCFLSRNYSFRYLIYLFIFSAFATVANLTLLNFFLSIVFINLCIKLFNAYAKTNEIKGVIIWMQVFFILIIASIFVYVMMPLIFNITSKGSYLGAQEGFWENTVPSLIWATLYEHSYVNTLLLSILIKNGIAGIFISAFCYYFFQLIKRKPLSIPNIFTIVLIILIIACASMMWVQNKCLDVSFSVHRTALYFIPLFTLLLVLFFNTASILSKMSSRFLLVSFASLSLIHFFNTVNFSSCLLWKYNADTKEVVSFIDKQHKINPIKNEITLFGIAPIYEQSINFYRVTHNLPWLSFFILNKSAEKSLCDYYLIPNDSTDKPIPGKSLNSIPFSTSSSTLFINKERKYEELDLKKNNFESGLSPQKQNTLTSKTSYSGRFSQVTDTLNICSFQIFDTITQNKNKQESLIWSKAMLYVSNIKADGLMAIAITRNGQTIFWKGTSIQDFIKEEKVWTPVFYNSIMPDGIQVNDRICVYLWNTGEKEILIDDLEFKILQYTNL